MLGIAAQPTYGTFGVMLYRAAWSCWGAACYASLTANLRTLVGWGKPAHPNMSDSNNAKTYFKNTNVGWAAMPNISSSQIATPW